MPSDSMSIGVSGLDAYQAQIDVISNNIANVGTTAFKSQNLTFQDLLYQTQQPGSAPSQVSGGVNYQQIGIGVKVGATESSTTQGGVQLTGVSTNMMINGDGYFILKNADGTGQANYTRNGDFSLNSDGILFDPSSGQAVMGYTANSAGVVSPGTAGPIQVPIGLKSQATATGQGVKRGPTGDEVFSMSFGGNLDSTQYAAAVSNGSAPASSLATTGTTIYDSLGGAHAVLVTLQPVPTLLNPNPVTGAATTVLNRSGIAVTAATEWAYTLSSTDGTKFGNTAAATSVSAVQYAYFDQGGQFINTSSLSTVPTAATVHQTAGLPSAAAGDQLQVYQWGATAGQNNSATSPAIPVPGPIGLDFSKMTSNASASGGLSTYQDGFAPGTLDSMTVGQDGTITGAFTNGQTVTIARVALAAFQNEQGLIRMGGSKFHESVSSGQAEIGTASIGRLGSIQGNALELSNVSISDEFTKLITAQNAFTANSKSITTANTDDQTVINLIR